MTIREKYHQLAQQPSDINQLLPYLKEYSSTCKHITEMGVRGVVSTYAFLFNKPDKLVSYDIIRHPNVDEAIELARQEGINFTFIEANVLKITIEPTEFLFIDTFHTSSQLSQELTLHSSKVSKFMAFHDTTTFWENAEPPYPELGDHSGLSVTTGLRYALEPFLEQHPEWKIAFRTEINNGLTILSR